MLDDFKATGSSTVTHHDSPQVISRSLNMWKALVISASLASSVLGWRSDLEGSYTCSNDDNRVIGKDEVAKWTRWTSIPGHEHDKPWAECGTAVNAQTEDRRDLVSPRHTFRVPAYENNPPDGVYRGCWGQMQVSPPFSIPRHA